MTDSRACEHSVWLVPDTASSALFTEEIASLAAAAGGTPFMPHITMAGDLTGPPGATQELCRAISGSLAPFEATVSAVVAGPQFFMSLFLDLTVPAHVTNARQQLCARLGLSAAPAWRPHISLAYGVEPGPDKEAIRVRLEQAHRGRSIPIRDVVVARSSATQAIDRWRVISRFRLGEAAL